MVAFLQVCVRIGALRQRGAVIYLARAVRRDRYLGHFLPDRVHVLIGSTLVCCDLRDYFPALAVNMEFSVRVIQIRRRYAYGRRRRVAFLFHLGPSEEDISIPGNGALDCYALVDLQFFVFVECSASVIPEPPDMRLCRFFRLDILRAQLYRIGLFLDAFVFPVRQRCVDYFSVLIQVLPGAVRYIYRISIVVQNRRALRICREYRELLRRIDLAVGNVYILLLFAVPSLHHPVRKHLSFRCGRRRLCDRLGFVDVEFCV